MRMKDLRISAGLSQKQLAELINIKRCNVTKWETGVTHPRAELLPKIAKVLNCSIDELLSDEGEK